MIVRKNLDRIRAQIETSAQRLGPVLPEVVYLGGAITPLLLTEDTPKDVRYTHDLDVIIEILTRKDFYTLQHQLADLGFRQPPPEEWEEGKQAPLCRWVLPPSQSYPDKIIMDIMPTSPDILGHTNKWYGMIIQQGHTSLALECGLEIRHARAPFFLASKFEAFFDRGIVDPTISKDLEDIVELFNGRKELLDEVSQSPQVLQQGLGDYCRRFLADPTLEEELAAHLMGSSAYQRERLPKIQAIIQAIAAL
ncbi:hypothetical protein V6C53_15290 [Desulfocurvibacter africanus]|uniref:hypothetical protein n=1 Tax=Desulfocurvibacter africanus TaxID=873 RepID=UPI0003FE1E58|nr:hypothetical protein [Desulfocurvibacter africanus]